MLLYFVRHGQTDFNIRHRLQGIEFDEPLNDTGIREMKELLPRLPHDFEVIYTSPLMRVKMSADIIAAYSQKPTIISDAISERNFGSLAGKTWDEIPHGREIQAMDKKGEYDYRPYGGESVADVEKRLRDFFAAAKGSGHARAIAVSSVGIIRLLYKMLLNEYVPEIDNASVHPFEI